MGEARSGWPKVSLPTAELKESVPRTLVNTTPDDRSSKAAAYQWAYRIMTVSLEMVLPGVGGYWVDSRLGTRPLFTLLGFGLGMASGFWHLLRMTNVVGEKRTDSSVRSSTRTKRLGGEEKDPN